MELAILILSCLVTLAASCGFSLIISKGVKERLEMERGVRESLTRVHELQVAKLNMEVQTMREAFPALYASISKLEARPILEPISTEGLEQLVESLTEGAFASDAPPQVVAKKNGRIPDAKEIIDE